MSVNKTLQFVPFVRGHSPECNICGRQRLAPKRGHVAVEFSPDETMAYAAVYCNVCIGNLAHINCTKAFNE